MADNLLPRLSALLTRAAMPGRRGAGMASRRLHIGLRLILIFLAAVGVYWSASNFPHARETAFLRKLTEKMQSAEHLDLAALTPVLHFLDLHTGEWACDDPAIGYSGIIRQYAAAVALSERPNDAGALLDNAAHDLRTYLACSPNQAFHWYSLFWVEATRTKSGVQFLPLLAMSYRLAPAESWIALFRCEDALPYFDQMSSELQSRTRDEYLYLARDGIDIAVGIFRAADPKVRTTLLEFMATTPVKVQREFAAKLDRYDLEIKLPGLVDTLGDKTP